MLTFLFGSPTKAPVLLKFRSSRTFIIVTVSTAVFTDIFVYGIVVPVLPFALKTRAGVAPDVTQQWIAIFLAVYGAGLLVAAPICGWVADRTSSRRMPMLLGLLALIGSTTILCLGRSIAVLAIGRALQGISASVPWVVGLALLVDTVGPDEVGQAMGYVGLSLSLAMLIAPLLGGIVFAQCGYYAVYAMAFGLMVLDIFLRIVMIEKKIAVQWTPAASAVEVNKDLAATRQASVLSSERGIELEATADSNTRTLAERSTQERPAMDHGEVVVSAPSRAEEITPADVPTTTKRWTARLPPVLTLLGSRRILSAVWAYTIQATLYTSMDTILPLYVRDTFHWNSTGAGLIFLPIVIVSFSSPIVGYLSDKHGPRWYAASGFFLATPFLILLRLVNKDTLDQKILLCALLALIGCCLTLMFTPMMAEIGYAVDDKARRRPPGYFGKNGAYAQAYSLLNVAWAAGCLIGPLLAGLTTQSAGWSAATLILGCISLFTAIPTVIWTGGSIFKKEGRRSPNKNGAGGGQVEAP